MMAGASAAQAPRPQPVASWPASRLISRTVVDARRAMQVGAVVDVVFSPEARQVVGLIVGTTVAESALLELARRVLGSDVGLAFVPIERVIALNADVVMIETEAHQSGELARPLPLPPLRHLPRLRRSLGYSVLTMQGQRLGVLDDLQLDAEGRGIKGYVVSRPAPAAAVPSSPVPAARAVPSQQLVPAPAPVPAPPEHFMIPVRFRVRFGRGLVVVGEDVSRPVVPPTPLGENPEWPAPRWADEPRDSSGAGLSAESQQSAEPTSPDAPTEELSPPAK